MIFSIALLGVMAFVLGLVVREVVSFRRTRATYSLRRLTLRLSSAVMLLCLLGSIWTAESFPSLYLKEPTTTPDLWMTFWGSITLLTSGIICLIIADMRLVGDDTRQDADRLWREIAETIAAHEKKGS